MPWPLATAVTNLPSPLTATERQSRPAEPVTSRQVTPASLDSCNIPALPPALATRVLPSSDTATALQLASGKTWVQVQPAPTEVSAT